MHVFNYESCDTVEYLIWAVRFATGSFFAIVMTRSPATWDLWAFTWLVFTISGSSNCSSLSYTHNGGFNPLWVQPNKKPRELSIMTHALTLCRQHTTDFRSGSSLKEYQKDIWRCSDYCSWLLQLSHNAISHFTVSCCILKVRNALFDLFFPDQMCVKLVPWITYQHLRWRLRRYTV